ncbi:MAG: RNA-binding domain-containing protein [Atribacterota bacterium]
MKKLVHNISVRVLEKDSTKIDNTKNGFNKVLPIDFEKENININHERAEGFNQKTIHILSMQTSKRRHNRLLLNTIFSKISEKDKKRVNQERETRVDTEGNFYLRLDKKSLLNKKYKITEGGDCFHLTVKLAAYPMNKGNILQSLEQLLEDMGIKK